MSSFRRTSILACAALIGLGCGSDAVAPTPDGDALDDVAPDVDIAPETEVTPDTIADSAPEDVLDAADTAEVRDATIASDGEVYVDRNCDFDPRLANTHPAADRCSACRSALSATRVRAELLWTGTYDAALPSAACAAYPDETCKASVKEAELLLCGNLATGVLRVTWSDIASLRLGTGSSAREVELRGPDNGVVLADVRAAAEDTTTITPAEAFEPGTWQLVVAAEDVREVEAAAFWRQTQCPIGRFTFADRTGGIAACTLAKSVLAKEGTE